MHKKLYIFGTESTAKEIYEVAHESKIFAKILFVSKNNKDEVDDKIISENKLSNESFDKNSYYILSMSDTKIKEKCKNLAQNFALKPHSVISNRAIISESSNIGDGVYIASNAIISSNSFISDHCLINFGVVVGHDSKIAEYCTLNPNSVVGGNTIIDKRVLIGANSVIKQNLSICSDCKIDALTYLFYDINEPSLCSGRFSLRVLKIKS